MSDPGMPRGEPGELDLLFRQHASDMVAILARVFGPRHLTLAEDVVQESFIKALQRWPFDGLPDNPRAWLLRVARNQALDLLRRDTNFEMKRKVLERRVEREIERSTAGAVRFEDRPRFDNELRSETLALLFACCDPVLSRDAQVTLVLKTIGGFSTREIARAFLAKPATIAARLTRSRARLAEAVEHFEIPAPAELATRLDAAHEALYLIFNEGYQAYEGNQLIRVDLCRESLRLALELASHPRTDSPASHALAALFCLQAARLPARTDERGDLVLLEHQRRDTWDPGLIQLGLECLARSASGDRETRYHLEAEIASCHSLAPSLDATDWRRILDCYDQLLLLNPSPVVALNRIIALWRAADVETALAELARLEHSSLEQLEAYQPYWATRAELMRKAGNLSEARACLTMALERTPSQPMRRFLESKLERLQTAAEVDLP